MIAFRVLVCGGRKNLRARWIWNELDQLLHEHGSLVVTHGKAPGSDSVARAWALLRKSLGAAVEEDPHPAHWGHKPECEPGCTKVTGRPAGMIRNREMLQEGRPQLVLAEEGGPGTAGMVKLARKAGVEVRRPPGI